MRNDKGSQLLLKENYGTILQIDPLAGIVGSRKKQLITFIISRPLDQISFTGLMMNILDIQDSMDRCIVKYR